MKCLLTISLTLLCLKANTQDFSIKQSYEDAFVEIQQMLDGQSAPSFKRAVFATENAYFGGNLDYELFNKTIEQLAKISRFFAANMNLLYEGQDKQLIKLYAAIFNVMTGQQGIPIDSSRRIKPEPYTYDFEDFFGEKDWSKMFVTKLLKTQSGNCHSMPFLYKIIAEELGLDAHLAMAPNHTYIKLYGEELGWYNTELTSATFPVDAWIMGSGYVHTSAVINRMYMDTLSIKQSLAVSLIDLAKGYERKTGKSDPDFLIKCADLSLEHYPVYANAIILKAETMKYQFEQTMKEYGVEHAAELFEFPEPKAHFDKMQALYLKVHNLGYRQMPKEMYLNWLADLNTQKEKYLNSNFKNLTNTETSK